MVRLIGRLGLLLCALVTTGVAGAQEKFKFTPPDQIPIPVEAGQKRVLPLTWQEALGLARGQNIDLKVQMLLPQKALEDLRIAKALFEPEVFGSTGYRSARTPGRNSFQPGLK